MKTYRIRYRHKKVADGNDDDDDLSEYTPSELSNMIDGEERSDDGSDFDEEEEEEVRSYIYIHISIDVYIYICMYIYVFICMCMCINTHIYVDQMMVHIYVYIYVHMCENVRSLDSYDELTEEPLLNTNN
jgi:hypothetical protein